MWLSLLYFTLTTLPIFFANLLTTSLISSSHCFYHYYNCSLFPLLGITLYVASSEQLPCIMCLASHTQCGWTFTCGPWISIRTRCYSQPIFDYDKCRSSPLKGFYAVCTDNLYTYIRIACPLCLSIFVSVCLSVRSLQIFQRLSNFTMLLFISYF